MPPVTVSCARDMGRLHHHHLRAHTWLIPHGNLHLLLSHVALYNFCPDEASVDSGGGCPLTTSEVLWEVVLWKPRSKARTTHVLKRGPHTRVKSEGHTCVLERRPHMCKK